MWFRRNADSIQPALQNAQKPKYPEVGDVFRSISFGMSEDEFEACMRRDTEVRIDSEHASPIHYITLFGTEFLISASYLNERLFRLFLSGDSMRSYSDELNELKDACIGMMQEKYGESTGLGNTRTYYGSGHCWDFNGKVIEVTIVGSGKYGKNVSIVITSTAMEDEEKRGRVEKNKAEYSKYGAYF